MRKKREFESIGKILKRSLGKLNLDLKLKQYQTLGMWREIVGERIAKYTQPEKVRDKTLWCKVSNSVWLQQLQFMSSEILKCLNERAGKELFEAIHFRLGTLDSKEKEKEPPEKRKRRSLTPKEKGRIQRNLRPISDPTLRKMVRNIMIHQLSLSKPKEE